MSPAVSIIAETSNQKCIPEIVTTTNLCQSKNGGKLIMSDKKKMFLRKKKALMPQLEKDIYNLVLER